MQEEFIVLTDDILIEWLTHLGNYRVTTAISSGQVVALIRQVALVTRTTAS